VEALAGLLGLDVNAPGPTPAAVDVFLKIPDIPGESKDPEHRDEIEVRSFSWGTSVAFDPQQDGTLTARSRLAELVVRKSKDASSDDLADAMRAGTVIPEMVLTLRTHATDRAGNHLEGAVTLGGVAVTRIADAGSPTEDEVAFEFETVQWSLPGTEPAPGTARTLTPVDAIIDLLGLAVHARTPTDASARVRVKFPNLPEPVTGGVRDVDIDVDLARLVATLDVDGGADGSGRIRFGDGIYGRVPDANSPSLSHAAAVGHVFPEIILTLEGKAGTAAAGKYLEIKLKDALIASYSQDSSGSTAVEELTIAAERVDW
jgi:type VI secretion system secreted protein Hcp